MSAPSSIPNAEKYPNRRSANFRPRFWGDHFLSCASETKETDHGNVKYLELKEEIRKMLMADINNLSKNKLDLIDAIQRLGVSYHFESQMDEILEKMHKAYNDCVPRDDENDDLHYVSLQFRLLRQDGYKISCDVFNKFKDSYGNFKASLVGDVRGMLSLYEASHLRVHGENILDEALAFTTTHLQPIATQFSTPYASQIKHALRRPIRKGILRLEARWWKELDVANKLPFARDRVVECYFWTLGVYFEPKYYRARWIVTKVLSMTSILDDIYDVYGTIEELELLTTAIERWDISAIDQLPEYMKLCYQALLDVYSESEEDLAYQGNLYRLHYAKKQFVSSQMKNLAKNYVLEAKWCNKKYVPTMDEYMTVALVTSTHPMLAATSFGGMGDIATREAFEWLLSNPEMLTASSVVGRLMNDIISHKFEQNRDHVASSVECYMKTYGVTEDEAYHELRKQVRNAWKDINEGCLRPTSVAMPLLMRILNLTRMVDVVYKDEDGYTITGGELEDFVASLLMTPMQL